MATRTSDEEQLRKRFHIARLIIDGENGGDPATDRAGCAPGLGDQLAFGLAVACAWSRRITSFPLGGLRPRSSLKATAKAA